MERRFYSPTPPQDDRLQLMGDEAQHLTKVLRARAGDRVIVFDGTGWEYQAEVTALERQSVQLVVRERQWVDRELPRPLHVGVALPKGDRQRWLVEKAVELGVTSLTPLETARAVAQATSAAVQRLNRYVIEASKQCGRNRLLAIHPSRTIEHFLQQAGADDLRLLAHPPAEGLPTRTLAELDGSQSTTVWVAIGPEGGFTPAECQGALHAGWQVVSLGPRVLRVETAVLMLAAWAGDWGRGIGDLDKRTERTAGT